MNVYSVTSGLSMHEGIVKLINEKVSGADAVAHIKEKGDSSVEVKAEKILEVAELLKTNPSYEFHVLQVISGVDEPDDNSIYVNYIIANFIKNHELILKTKVPRQGGKLASVTSVWKSANWQERECYDMVGVEFTGHPDFRRILCPEDWEGFPLLKDYKPAEKYKHMVINPEEKMNIPDREFAERQKAIEDAAKAKGE